LKNKKRTNDYQYFESLIFKVYQKTSYVSEREKMHIITKNPQGYKKKEKRKKKCKYKTKSRSGDMKTQD